MIHSRKWLFVVGIALTGTTIAFSQGRGDGALPVATTGDQVVIKREACRVVEPSRYRVPLSLEAISTVTLVAPFDGTIKQIISKANSKLQSQGDVIRFDNTDQKLRLDRAQAAMKLASLELRRASKEEEDLAQAKVDLAKFDVDIAKSVAEKTTVRMPFAGEVQRILVAEGQFVRAGDPIAIVADPKIMKVEIPVDRAAAVNGKALGIKIEADDVEGKIDAVLPLPGKFESLRDLFDSIASVQVVVENPTDRYKVGQTVYAPMIPRQPVVEVAVSAVGNLPDGQRKVQVVRQNIVRDISIRVLGQVGSNRVFVSGAFAEGDEVIYESSHLLGDAFQLKPFVSNAANTTSPGQPATTPSKPSTGAGF